MSNLIARPAKEEEMEEIYRLRYKVFCEELKYLNSINYPDGKETDEYDDRSHHIVILRNNKIVGYSRIILPRKNVKFLMEEAILLPQIFDRNLAVEVSRGIVIPEKRGSGVKDMIIKAIFDYCKENGFRFILSFSNKMMFDIWKKEGVEFLHIGKRVKQYGVDAWPLIILVN